MPSQKTIQRIESRESAPLSFSQERFWFLDQFESDKAVNNRLIAFRLTGLIETVLIERTLNEIVVRHEILRTSFTLVGEKPRQIIAPNLILAMPHVDLEHLVESEREKEALRLMKEELEHPFDLSQCPLLKPILYRLGDKEHILFLNTHHIIFDGWSERIFLGELATIYKSFIAGNPNPLPDLPVQYADYAQWQRNLMKGQVLDSHISYWKQRLDGAPPIFELPTDMTRPLIKTCRGSKLTVLLTNKLSEGLKSLSRREGSTLFMALLAAFKILLQRYTGQFDIVVGTPVANRTKVEIEELIGFFVNTLVLRTDLSGNPTFRELLGRIRETALEAYAHQDLPFERLVEEVHPERNLSYSPLFQIIFNLENVPKKTLKMKNVSIAEVEFCSDISYFDLELEIIDKEDGLCCSFIYNSALFNASTIERMARHFQYLLERIVANPEQHIESLSLLTEAERRQLLEEWNDSGMDYPGKKCIHELFEEQVKRSPDAVAVIFEDQRLTYRELNTKANQLAKYLRKHGVGPEVLVGVCVERSLEMIVSILGILKAGGAYVPLDPAYPKERLAFMLDDAKVPVLLTQQPLLHALPNHMSAIICIDSDWDVIAQCDHENLLSGVAPGNAAYVIYTSGSTGKPKGVLVTHYNVMRLFEAVQPWYQFNGYDVWTMFHSYSFDFSVWEIWGALLHGGQLVVVPYLVSRSPEEFYDLLSRERVTVLSQTPSAFRQLIWVETSASTKAELTLRYVIFGGEALELQSLKPWFDRHGDQKPKLINMYGITETTVHVTYRPISLYDLSLGKGSVIGGPIPDLQLYVLDENLTPVTDGTAGELYVCGAGLARGYLNRPELTAERFIPDPFNKLDGNRLYKTGDVVRRLPDGDLEYMGRCDDQVKIRGFRIELGEILSVLNSCPEVQESVVIADDGGTGDKRLIAYVVSHPGRTVSTKDLRGFLKKQLPDYMVPALFMFLEKMPLTPNGKVDRKALPHPDKARPEFHDGFMAPEKPEEKMLAEIYSEVLQTSPVGIHDSFFELGGDSIRAIQLLARAHLKGLKITLAQLFHEQTIAKVLRQIDHDKGTARGKGNVQPFAMVSTEDRQRLPPDIEDAYPMLMLQIGMFYHNEKSPESAVYHDVFSFRIGSAFDQKKFETAIDQFIGRHPAIRTSFDLDNFGEPLQFVHKTVRIPLTVEDLQNLSYYEQTQNLEHFIHTEKRRSFDRTQAPLMRIIVQIYNDLEFQMIVSFHHAIMDGWSLASMLTEILQDYFGLIRETGRQVSAPKVHYREYVALEHDAIASEECRRFWAEKLAGSHIQVLPRWPKTCRSGGAEQVRSPEVIIPDDVFAGVKELAHKAGVPLKSVLLTAHYRVMSLLHGETDVISGLVTNGRPEEIDGERMIGLFLNTVPLRIHMPGGVWLDLVRKIFAAECEMLPYRRYPLAEVQRITGAQHLLESAFDFVHFHVYQNLQGYKDKGFMEGCYFEANSFILLTTFMMDVTATQLQMHMDYQPAELCLNQIEAILGYYVNTLTAMAKVPVGRYESFCPLSAAEYQQTLADWNATRREYPNGKCIHELFEAQVEKTPDAVAVVFEDQQLTYRELNTKANQLAHYLEKRGVEPEVLVGICVERSLEMVIGILGILKAGGAYMPLDPSYPKERLAYMMEDAHPSVLVTKSHLAVGLPQHTARLVLLDADSASISRQSDKALHAGASQETLAYLIYTSGSTDKPKGVMITHANLGHYVQSIRIPTGVTANDRYLHTASISFSSSVRQWAVPLSQGATVVIAASDQIRDPLALFELIKRHSVTVMDIVPSYWRNCIYALGTLESGQRDFLLSNQLRLILSASEPLLSGIPRDWAFKFKHGALLINMFGLTETTGIVAVCPISPKRDDKAEIVPIGRPIGNTQIYLLNSHLQPVPIGVPGEIHVGGAGIGRGYLNHPELTERKFIADPFSIETGARLYKTGDMGRLSSDGTIECIGRMDHQVKIRGFRIEPGEIESVLCDCPGVRDAAVITRKNSLGDKQLVAYVVPNEKTAVTDNELRNFLRQKLPDYMMPSAFVALDSLPLTPSGKIDRRALPAPDSERPGAEDSYVAPRTPIEELLASIWSEILGLKQVGIHDNFFESGGHSLLATQVISRLRNAFQIQIPLRSLFESPTIAELAIQIIQSQDEISDPEELALLLSELEGSASGSVSRFKEIEDER
ncbi:MAG: amino acid adenylation domain-containing protein [Thermodesulfovibrionales bacterium]